MPPQHCMSLDDMKEYLRSYDIDYTDAQKISSQVRQHYPHLGSAVHNQRDVRADLELMVLIHHVKCGRFPITSARINKH